MRSAENEKPVASNEAHIRKDKAIIDYDTYIMTGKEKTVYIILAAAAIYIIGFIFYRSFILAALLCPLALYYPKIRTKEIIEKRKNDLNLQFKDMLYALSSSLTAGKSVEMAFRDVLKDLSIIYPAPDTLIIREVELMLRKLTMNQTIESVLGDFAKRAHLEDVQNFVDVFHVCKRTGGNIVDIIRNTSNIINDKIEIKQEIDTMLAARRFEQKVLNIMPILMIVILSTSSADYMEPVFTTAAGRIVMTIAVVLLAAAYFVSKKIMKIKV